MKAHPPTLADAVLGLLGSLGRSAGSIVVDAGGDPEVRAALEGAGFACVEADPAAPGPLTETGATTGPLGAIWLGDALQRVDDPGALLEALRSAAVHADGTPLLVAVSNVTHRDVAANLLVGRWEPTDTGILQESHRRQFSASSLERAMAAHGWAETGRADLVAVRSDQHRAGAAPCETATSLGAQLAAVRDGAGPDAFVTTFLRAYEPGPYEEPAGATEGAVPFLSVLVRTQGRRWATLHETLLSLAAQHCDDLEVLVLLHDGAPGARETLEELVGEFHPSFSSRVRIVEVSGGGRAHPLNEGAKAARGRYLAILDDDDLVFAHWAQRIAEAADRAPGRLVRLGVATQHVIAGAWDGEDGYEIAGRPRLDFALDADHLEHVLDNRTPVNGYAVPRSLVTELGVTWDDSLDVLEDWDHILRAMAICGLENVAEIAGLLRWWDEGQDSKHLHDTGVWERARAAVIANRNAAPLVLAAGSFSRLRSRVIDGDVAHVAADARAAEVDRLSAELDAARAQLRAEAEAHQATRRALADVRGALDAVYASTSWKATEALRQGAALARRAGAIARQRLDERH